MQNSDMFLLPFTCLGGVFPCIGGLLGLFGMVFGVVGIALWIWMLVDVIQRDEKDFPSSAKDQKILWLLVVILGSWIGALVYYLMVYKKAGNQK